MKILLEQTKKLIKIIDEVARKNNHEPKTGSIFKRELSTYSDTTRIHDPYAFGEHKLRAGREKLFAVAELLAENNVFAAAVNARAVIEVASFACWLLEPSINAKERVKRGIIHLCDGKVYAQKIHKSQGDIVSEKNVDDFFNKDLPAILNKNVIEFRNRKGKLISPQQKMPKFTDLIKEYYRDDIKFAYQILSSVAHGQPFALIVAGYNNKDIREAKGLKRIKYSPNPNFAGFVVGTSVDAFIKATEFYFIVNDWDFAEVKESHQNFVQVFADYVEELLKNKKNVTD